MRITHDNWGRYFTTCPLVLIDGAAVDRVIEADDEEGYAIVYETKDGALVVENDRIVTKRLTGKVEFIGVHHP